MCQYINMLILKYLLIALLLTGCSVGTERRFPQQLAAVCTVLPDACDAITAVPVIEVDTTEHLCYPAGPSCYRLDEHVIYFRPSGIDMRALITHEYVHAALDALDLDDNHGPNFRAAFAEAMK